MSNKSYLGCAVSELDTAPAFLPFSKVIAWYDDEHAFSAGDDTGRTLEVDLPFATQEIVNSMLQRIKGYSYQPFSAVDALIDPAAELGDGVTVNGVYSVLARNNTKFDALGAADIGAPEDEEIDHEYPYLDPQTRAMQRKLTLGASYYGTRITRANGLEIVKTAADGTQKSRVKLNSDLLAFYNEDGAEALYFDAAAGKFKFTGLLNVSDNFIVDADGNVTINGNINLSGGSITWGDNKPSSGISASQARTIINEELVSSPNIAGGRFLDLNQRSWLEMGIAGTNTAYINHYTDTYGNDPVCVMGYVKGVYPAWVIAPFGLFALEFQNRGGNYPYTYAYGDWDFSVANVTGLYLRFS